MSRGQKSSRRYFLASASALPILAFAGDATDHIGAGLRRKFKVFAGGAVERDAAAAGVEDKIQRIGEIVHFHLSEDNAAIKHLEPKGSQITLFR